MIASSMSSFSEPHIDAAGYATVMKVITGSKLWYLQCTRTGTETWSVQIPSRGGEWDYDRSKWCPVHLQTGDLL